jgi:hypothetical protein
MLMTFLLHDKTYSFSLLFLSLIVVDMSIMPSRRLITDDAGGARSLIHYFFATTFRNGFLQRMDGGGCICLQVLSKYMGGCCDDCD